METITITIEELNQRIEEKINEKLSEMKPKPTINYAHKFGKIVEEWLEHHYGKGNPTPKYKAAIYESVKACLGISFITQLSEETYENALKIFEEQKLFFQRRVFPEDCQPKEMEDKKNEQKTTCCNCD